MRRTLLTLVLSLAVVIAVSAQEVPRTPNEGEHGGRMGMPDGMEMVVQHLEMHRGMRGMMKDSDPQ